MIWLLLLLRSYPRQIVKLIMDKNYDPVIVFSFSKKDVEALALAMSKLDFNTDTEKANVEMIFNSAIDQVCLFCLGIRLSLPLPLPSLPVSITVSISFPQSACLCLPVCRSVALHLIQCQIAGCPRSPPSDSRLSC